MRALLVVGLLIFAGCQSAPTTARLESRFANIVGKPESFLISELGVPDTVYTSGGVKYLSFKQVHADARGLYSCKMDFQVVRGVVRGYRYAGNMCRA